MSDTQRVPVSEIARFRLDPASFHAAVVKRYPLHIPAAAIPYMREEGTFEGSFLLEEGQAVGHLDMHTQIKVGTGAMECH